MRNHKCPAEERKAGDSFRREIKCREIFPDQCSDEPEILNDDFCYTGKDADDQFL